MPEGTSDMTAAFTSALSSGSETPAATASPAVTPEPSTPAEPSAPAATTQAAETPSEPASVTTETPATEEKKEPPTWRWQDILENARQKAAQEAEARVKNEHAWAQEIAAHERDGLLTWRAAMNGDPRAIAHIKSNPQAVQWLRSLIAEQQQPQADPEPEPDLQAGDGTLVYSAQQYAKREAWAKQQWMKEVNGLIQPLKQTVETVQQRESRAQAYTEVSQVVQEFRADPEFDAHRADVGAEIQKDPRLVKLADEDPKSAVEIAWNRVYRAKVLPAKQQASSAASESAVLANLQQRAVAATPNPSAAVASTPKKFQPGQQGFQDALQHYGSGGR